MESNTETLLDQPRPHTSLELGKIEVNGEPIYFSVHFDNLETLVNALMAASKLLPEKLWVTGALSPYPEERTKKVFEDGTN